MAQGPEGTNANFLEAKNFGLRIAFFSLFSGRLVIKQVSLVSPNVIWPQNADGKWRLPDLKRERVGNPPAFAAKPENSSPTKSESAEPPAQSAATAKPAKQHAVVPDQQTKAPAAFVSEIHKVSLIDGTFRFLGRANEPVASFEGVNFRASISNASALHGNARVTRVALRDRFFLQQLRSPLRYDSDGLELSQVSARVGDGDVSGHFTMQPE